MKKVWLDAGHGGSDSGAVGNNLREKDITLQLVMYTQSYLKQNYQNVEVELTRTTDVFVSLHERVKRASYWGADIFVSIHVNAGGGTGFETYSYPRTGLNQMSTLQKALHTEIVESIKKYGSIVDRGLKQANYAVLRETPMLAVLTENLFIDTATDAEKLKKESFLHQVGEAHARGIAKHLGLPLKEKTSYVVQTNDTFYSVAKKYNITVQQLQYANPEVDPTILQMGQYIIIPKI